MYVHPPNNRLNISVSMGGTAGLFLGASILSLVELPYFLMVRGFRNALKSDETVVIKVKKRQSWREKLSNSFRFSNITNKFKLKKGKFGIQKSNKRKQIIQPYINRRSILITDSLNYNSTRYNYNNRHFNQTFYQ